MRVKDERIFIAYSNVVDRGVETTKGSQRRFAVATYMTKASKIIIAAVLAILIVAIFSIGSCELRKWRLKSAVAQVEIGNSKQQLINLLGEPDEIAACRHEDICKDEYYYYSFMERWMIYFDKDDKVIDTGYNVSY